MIEADKIALKMRKGEIDCNNQELFFSILIKGLLTKLNKDIYIRQQSVPHVIINTGDDQVYLNVKGQNQTIEPLEVSNEDYVYNVVPRCIVSPEGITIESDQVTNPYSNGEFQYKTEDQLYTFAAEFRRLPVKLNINLKYYVNTYNELLELTQYILTKLCFIQTYNIVYLGQTIKCSYKIPDQFTGEYLTELTGSTNDNRCKTMELTLEIETNLPVFSIGTVVSTEHAIINLATIKGDQSEGSAYHLTLYEKGGLNDSSKITDVVE